MKLSSNMESEKNVCLYPLAHIYRFLPQFNRLKHRYTIFPCSIFFCVCAFTTFGLFIQIFALILFHFAFRTSITLHEIDINKKTLSRFSTWLSKARVLCMQKTIATGFSELPFQHLNSYDNYNMVFLFASSGQ